MTWCKRECRCAFCPEPIKLATPMVVGKLWFSKGKPHKWYRMLRWHVDCWVKQGLMYLETHPYVASGARGRKQIQLPEEQRKERLAIIRRRASYVQRLRKAVEEGNMNKVVKIFSKIDVLKEEIESLGGMPKSWE